MFRHWLVSTFVVACAGVGASLAYAPGATSTAAPQAPTTPLIMSRGMFEPGGGVFGLLSLAEVQKELRLTPEQFDRLAPLHKEMLRGAPKTPKEYMSLTPEESKVLAQKRDKAIAYVREELPKILQPDQFERLKQIRLQVEGIGAFFDPGVRDALGMTEEQRTTLDAVRKETLRELDQHFNSMTPGTPRSEFMAKREQIREKGKRATLAVLTPQQKESFEKMQGRKMDLGR
jgi:Spy/CpxP family protein refolding chaperone